MPIDSEKLNCGAARHHAGGATVLLVEDEISVRKLVVRFLVLYGFKVLEAEHGPAAVLIWNERKDEIDLLLTDVVMPGGLSGAKIAEQFQADRPTLKILYTSGYSMELLNADLTADEGIHFLQKPYRPEQLLAAVRTVLAEDRHPLETLC